MAHDGGFVDAHRPTERGYVANQLRSGATRQPTWCRPGSLFGQPTAREIEVEDCDAVIGDAVAGVGEVEAKIGAPHPGERGAGGIAEELVAEAADEAHGDRPGHAREPTL